MKYRKKPVVIEAMQWLPEDSLEAGRVIGWLGAQSANFRVADDGVSIIIGTLEGKMRADPTDWIIRGVRHEFYPCKADVFQATYESVDA